jgi:hypothetical protein
MKRRHGVYDLDRRKELAHQALPRNYSSYDKALLKRHSPLVNMKLILNEALFNNRVSAPRKVLDSQV